MNKHLRLRATLTLIGFLLMICFPAPAQESAIVGVPDVIKAGEMLSFTIKLDKAPSFDGGIVQFTVIGPDVAISASTVVLKAGQTDCPASIRIPAAATGGKWQLHIDGFHTGTKQLPLKSVDTTFEVLANKDLVFPTSVEVRINPSQVQLLRTAAIRLQVQVQNFKAALAPYKDDSSVPVFPIIQRNIGDAIKSLSDTQSSFRELASAVTQPAAEYAFFDDLRTNYKAVLAMLDKDQVRSGFAAVPKRSSFVEMSQRPKPEAGYAIAAQAALRPFEQNELAYKIVADTESLTFDLSVNSNPAGASVCYHRRGDPCHPNTDATNTVIKSLPYAIWLVQFRKEGYRAEEREHDPFREPNHVMNADLQPQGKGP